MLNHFVQLWSSQQKKGGQEVQKKIETQIGL